MPATSQYKNYTVPTNLGDAGLWGAELNTTLGLIDANLGGTLVLQSSASPTGVTLTSTQAANLNYQIQGALTQNYALTFTSSLGGSGFYVIDNQTTGSFSVTVTQTSTGSTALTIPQGGRSAIAGDGTTFRFADDNQVAKLYSQVGTPQGNVAGNAATTSGGATSVVRDVTNQITYVAKLTGTSATTLWVPQAGLPAIGGYLTVSTDANNPVPVTDFAGVSSVFWTPLTSNWCWASDGQAVFPVQFSRMTLTLTNTNNAASQLQDVYFHWNAGTPVIGTGPTWAAGTGGSVTAGACARGTGVGGAAVARVQGAWTNTVSMTINNGASSYVMAAGEGIYIGSVFIDSAAGQVTCNTGSGQNRKYGTWSAFNRAAINLAVSDSTASWTYATGTWRQSNGSASNRATAFVGLREEMIRGAFNQCAEFVAGSAAMRIGVGVNTTASPSGKTGEGRIGNANFTFDMTATYSQPALLGISNWNCLEIADGGTTVQFDGAARMSMEISYRG